MTKAARLFPKGESNVVPLVAPKRGNDRAVWIFGIILASVALLLFFTLDERRRAVSAPATTGPQEVGTGRIAAPPGLVIPRDPDAEFYTGPTPIFRVEAPPGRRIALARRSVSRSPARPSPAAQQPVYEAVPQSYVPVAPSAPPAFYEPPAVFDPAAPQQQPLTAAEETQSSAAGRDRAFATRLTNPGTTVPLGTVIPAVLESALDSTRPGAVRAIVSRDVRGFDGTRTLIPRGSRLYGEYGAELAPGQSRALVRWTRLIRPDGAMVALDSPASDPLGRAGLKGRVDSKFLERFGEAVLQSTLDVGVGVASRGLAGSPLIYAVPAGAPAAAPRGRQQVQRTLKVRQGTSVSVFVARDLDFTAVEN